ncbi:hypothetical protein M422DRAFT_198996 [Sphaerobolus stellatus SS14]|nr:hypothetical protein M422DRAFT_198996 [Sphaerobolus stellatus SS14]
MLLFSKRTFIINGRAIRSSCRALSSTFPRAKTIEVQSSDSHIILPAESTPSHNAAHLPWRWLRDSCPCPQCVHPSTQQKLHRSSDVSAVPWKAEVTDGELRIDWRDRNAVKESEAGTPFQTKGSVLLDMHDDKAKQPSEGDRASLHRSVYPLAWLQNYITRSNRESFHLDDSLSRVEWDKKSLLAQSPSLFVDYSDLDKPKSLQKALTQLIRFGIVFVRGVPAEKKDDDNCELRKLAGIFGRIRDTFYGPVWDVRSIKESKNIAYTNLDLGLHMDLLYTGHPPRFQILHCLLNRVHGGTSYFVDAIHAASLLRAQDSPSFTSLANTPVPYHYINDGHHLWQAHPIIELSPFIPHSTSTPEDIPEVAHINYSPPFQAPLYLETPDRFYDAMKEYADILAKEEGEYRYTMEEGDAVIFDNRRVLHARTEFWDKEGMESGEGGTRRWLKGCYLEADDVLDRARVLIERSERLK